MSHNDIRGTLPQEATVTPIQLLLFVEAAVFGAASLVHRGLLIAGLEHRRATTAEMVIAVVLLAAFAIVSIRPMWLGRVGLAAQGFALLGTMVGVVMIAIGVGPQTVPDVLLHAGLVVLLVAGLVMTVRAPA
jgi:hypothetical protein